MSLIEQLGGYDRAKDALDLPLNYGFSDDDIKAALLEYRRQHNIFEVGDYVLRNDGFYNIVMVRKINGSDVELIRYVDGEPRWSCFNLSEIHHATDAEIKAGHKLEQCQ